MRRTSAPILVIWLLVSLLFSNPVQAESIPREAHIAGVDGHAQSFNLSCESRSAVDWAAFWGVPIRERKFLANLPRSDNPDEGFVGYANDAWGNIPPASYGVHARPVAALLRVYGLKAEARQGMTWDELRLEIAAGRPVIVWVIGQVWPGNSQKYRAADGKVISVARFEHTVIVVGYNPSSVQIVDAYTGQTQTHPRRTFLASWSTLGNMAVTGAGVNPSALAPAPATTLAPAPVVVASLNPWSLPVHVFVPAIYTSPAQAQSEPAGTPKTYTVKRGDYLTAIARRFGVDWRELARINALSAPYTLYSGQVLKIK